MPARPRLVKIDDTRGLGLAEVEGNQLAILFERHWNFHNKAYREPITPEDQGSDRLNAVLGALARHDLIVMRRDQPLPGEDLAYGTYIGVFRFRDLVIGSDAFTLTLVERYASPSS